MKHPPKKAYPLAEEFAGRIRKLSIDYQDMPLPTPIVFAYTDQVFSVDFKLIGHWQRSHQSECVERLLGRLGLTATSLSSSTRLYSDWFCPNKRVWVVHGLGYVVAFNPDYDSYRSTDILHVDFLPLGSPRMAWYESLKAKVLADMEIVSSFEFDAGSGSVKRQPEKGDYRESLARLRGHLRNAGLISDWPSNTKGTEP